jgi:hypothetical protein
MAAVLSFAGAPMGKGVHNVYMHGVSIAGFFSVSMVLRVPLNTTFIDNAANLPRILHLHTQFLCEFISPHARAWQQRKSNHKLRLNRANSSR